MVILNSKTMDNSHYDYPKKVGKGNLPTNCGNIELVIIIYVKEEVG